MTTTDVVEQELSENWHVTSYGYRHEYSDYVVHWWNSNRDTVDLYRNTADELLSILHGVSLEQAVRYVVEP